MLRRRAKLLGIYQELGEKRSLVFAAAGEINSESLL